MAVTGRGVTFPTGFTAGAIGVGVKDERNKRLDVALLVADRPCAAAGVFTSNQVIAAPCVVTKRHLASGSLRAVVVNSGNANACTGEQGERDALAMAEAAARTTSEQFNRPNRGAEHKDWPALLRMLERKGIRYQD